MHYWLLPERLRLRPDEHDLKIIEQCQLPLVTTVSLTMNQSGRSGKRLPSSGPADSNRRRMDRRNRQSSSSALVMKAIANWCPATATYAALPQAVISVE
jgi:hypothetical protein